MNPQREIVIEEQDRIIYNQEIRPYLPEKLFDAHCHLVANQHHPGLDTAMPLALDPMLGDVDRVFLKQWWQALFPDAQTTGFLMGTPTRDCNLPAENAFVAQEAGKGGHPFALLTHPATTPEALERDVSRLSPAGLKPYMCFAEVNNPEDAHITDLIPEAQLDVANRHGLVVMLHVAGLRGMAEPRNLDDLAGLVAAFPRCRFILAHCGRCFIAPNMEAAVEKLPVAPNLWVDTSAVCDTGVFLHLFRGYGPARILFGTDLVTAAGFRGAYVRLGLSWHPCTPADVSGLTPRATFAAYENLAALLRAARFCKLDKTAINRIFFENAVELFGIQP